jgi:hypothetical protein
MAKATPTTMSNMRVFTIIPIALNVTVQCPSEWYVVIRKVGLLFEYRSCSSCIGATARPGDAVTISVFTAGGRTHAFTAAKHLHFVADDLGGVTFVAVLVLPLVGPDPPFDIDLTTFLEVLAGRFG